MCHTEMRKAQTKSKLLSQPFVKAGNHEWKRKGLVLLFNVGPICSLNGVNKIQQTAIISSAITVLLKTYSLDCLLNTNQISLTNFS